MKERYRSAALTLTVLLVSLFAAAQAPQVSKVEPPNWWIGLPPNPVVLLTGEGLEGARITATHPGVRVLKTQVQPGGRYAFAWLDVTAAKPGKVALQVATARGRTTAPLLLEARKPLAGRFQGLSYDDVIYLIMPDRFADGDPSNNNPRGAFDRTAPKGYHGGDLRGIAQRLPYLKELGVTAIWMTPFWANTESDYHGYHPVDMYAVEQHFGTMADLQNLVQEAHKSGIKIIIDYVVNHTGPLHPWANNPPTATWLNGSPKKHLEPVYRFNGIIDPHAPKAFSRGTLEGWFASKLPDLNTDDPLLATYLLQNAIWWTEMTGLDAYRLDTYPYSSRRFWSGWHQGIFRAYPTTFTIGETWDLDPTVVAFFQGGRKGWDGIDTGSSTQFDFPLMDAIRATVARGESMEKIVGVLQKDSEYPRYGTLVTFIGNHDIERFLTDAMKGTPADPAKGTPAVKVELPEARAKLKAAFSLLLTLRGIPQIYYGDEIAMEGGADPDNRREFPGGFPGEANAFTAASRLDFQQEMFQHVQSLLKLRREHSAFRGGKHWHLFFDPTSYVFLRENAAERIVVAYNNAGETRRFRVPLADTPIAAASAMQPVFGAGPATVQSGSAEFQVEPRSIAVYAVK